MIRVMELSVVINTMNRPHPLARCLAHLANQRATAPWEVIVVDDGGAVDLASVIAPFKAQLAVRLHAIEHRGIAAARNAGAALAQGRRLWFVGDDVLTDPACWALHAAETDPQVAVLGPYPLESPGLSPALQFWIDANRPAFIRDAQNAGFCFFLTGNLSIDRTMFNSLGGFDEGYRHYGWEDLDLGLKFELAGGRIRYEARAAAIHAHPGHTRAGLWRREYWVGYTGRRFYAKWRHLGEKLAPVRFWPLEGEPAARPTWRLALGRAVAAATDTLLPSSGLNARVIERMVFATRLRGFIDGNNPENLAGVDPP
jgi:glycosyltransferase involved in cell wall biosynthesis